MEKENIILCQGAPSLSKKQSVYRKKVVIQCLPSVKGRVTLGGIKILSKNLWGHLYSDRHAAPRIPPVYLAPHSAYLSLHTPILCHQSDEFTETLLVH